MVIICMDFKGLSPGPRQRFNYLLHGPPMMDDMTNFGSVLYNHANFYRFGETSSYWSVTRQSVFLCFSLVSQRHTSIITVYNGTVTNIENTVQAVHSCNSWFESLSGRAIVLLIKINPNQLSF